MLPWKLQIVLKTHQVRNIELHEKRKECGCQIKALVCTFVDYIKVFKGSPPDSVVTVLKKDCSSLGARPVLLDLQFLKAGKQNYSYCILYLIMIHSMYVFMGCVLSFPQYNRQNSTLDL